MERHPYFDLILHGNKELESYLGGQINGRQTLHEWPLSCVQLLTLEDGCRRVYKTSSGPTVEAQFYAQACSRVLIPFETIYQDDKYSCLLFEYLDAPCLSECKLDDKEALSIGQELQAAISQVTGQFPVYMDISTWESWQYQVTAMLNELHYLVSSETFRTVTPDTIARIESCAFSMAIRSAVEGPAGLVHHDLTEDNVFCLVDGYRIIDWQRPILGPLGLDLATLAESLGYDSVDWVGPEIQKVKTLLHIHWFTRCAVQWFPPGAETYDQQIADLVARNL